MRKRKATKDIAPAPKKIPLENISNKPVVLSQQDTSKNVTVKSERSTFIQSSLWLSKTLAKKEITEDVKVKVEVDETMDDALLKFNEQFRNSIIIEFRPLVVKKEINEVNCKDPNNTSKVNFKLFKKVSFILFYRFEFNCIFLLFSVTFQIIKQL